MGLLFPPLCGFTLQKARYCREPDIAAEYCREPETVAGADTLCVCLCVRAHTHRACARGAGGGGGGGFLALCIRGEPVRA